MINVKETAKMIRKELKEKFPFTKFSVRCERSGSINVSWTDFPTEKAVEEVVSKYEQVQRCEVTGEILTGGNLFVFTRQTWSNELKNKIENEMHNNYGESYLNDRACWYRAFNETAEKLYNEFLQTLEQPKEAKQEQHREVKATYTLNEELNGIEITFTGVPSEEVRNELKANGFRWSKYKKVWYAKQTAERLEFVKMLVGETEQTEEVTEQSEAQQESERQETLTDAYNAHKSLIDLIVTNRQFNDALRMTDLKPYVVTLQNAYYDVKENNKYSFIQPVDVHNAVNALQNSELFNILKSEYVTESEHDNTQQVEERLQTESKEQPQKIKVKSIAFLWSESPVIKKNTTVKTWTEANKIIKDVAFSIDTGGYRKTAFFIVWEDNSTYEGRIDVQASDLYKNAPLSEHIKNFALGMAGIKKPIHWTQEDYENYLNAVKSDREAWKNFLDTYMLHDEETPKSPHDPYDHVGNNRDNGVTTIVTEETQPLQEVLFYHEALTEAQNAKINEILNRHKDSNKFTFVAVYKCKSKPYHAILHVINELGKDQYFYFTTAGLFAFSTHEISYYDRHVYGVELLHTFTNNSDNMQELGNEQEEKAVNDTIQDVENSNNTNETHELDILQEQSNHDTLQEEIGNHNNNSNIQTLQVSYKINDEKNGIELYFSDKPSEAIREQLKQMGFRWLPIRSIWYAKKTDERLQFALSLLSDSYNSELTEEQQKTLEKRLRQDKVKPLRLFKNGSGFVLLECLNTDLSNPQPFYFLIRPNGEEMGKGYDSDILNGYSMIYNFQHNSDQEKEPESYPYIDIDDIETYVIDEKIQEAEYAASWIFRTQKRDHTKKIQDFFMQYNSKVKELLGQTDNERIKYYLKKSLQSFKKRYFDNYVKILRHRSENPSWAITGRGNLNKRKYDKALSRYDKLIQESIELTKQIDVAINRAKNEIQKEKEQRIKEAVKNVNNDLTFTVMTKEIEYMGYKERKRVYVYGDYWTARLWGCYRIFKSNREIHEMKSTDKLEDAKQYIAYLVQQEQKKAKNVITA
jgi:Large polyvalent protein associated domain 29